MAEGEALYTIESDIPLPPISRTRSGGRAAKYPFDKMEVNQSFSVPFGEEDPKKVTRRVRTAILVYHRGKNNKEKKFNTRQLDADGVVRVWRSE